MTRVVLTERGSQPADKLIESLTSNITDTSLKLDMAGESSSITSTSTCDKSVTTPYHFNQFTTPCILATAANIARVGTLRIKV